MIYKICKDMILGCKFPQLIYERLQIPTTKCYSSVKRLQIPTTKCYSSVKRLQIPTTKCYSSVKRLQIPTTKYNFKTELSVSYVIFSPKAANSHN